MLQIYLSYAAWANNNGFAGIRKFSFRHAAEGAQPHDENTGIK
jgi:ferritin